jgi:DNA repair protein RecO (recombination protein O)
VSTSGTRFALQHGYILHRRPYRDTSHILEVFTEEHGRLGLVARGGRGRREWQGLLQPFVPLLLSWSGRGELATLTAIESVGASHSLAGTPLLCGFYLNELLLRLLQRFDPHVQLFNVYATTLSGLARAHENAFGIEWGLRIFERDLLQELGYGLVLDHDVDTGDPVQEAETYRYVLGHGPVGCEPDLVEHAADTMVHGHSLLALHLGLCHDPLSLREAKRLMRAAIDQQLAGRPLHTRRLLRDLHAN